MFSIYIGKNNFAGDFPSRNFVSFVVDFKIVNQRAQWRRAEDLSEGQRVRIAELIGR
jgi:hypothetical protein